MDNKKLKLHVKVYLTSKRANENFSVNDESDRKERCAYYQSWTKKRLLNISEDEIYEYLSKLWAMRMWGNKKFYVDKVLDDNGIEKVGSQIASLIWDNNDISERWDDFRSSTKGIGIAMMSEILCYVHPTEFPLWNKRIHAGLNYLNVPSLPRYDYQMDGKKYKEISKAIMKIQQELELQSGKKITLLDVDYFIWRELQVTEKQKGSGEVVSESEHDEIQDKIAKIGDWLGFEASTERKVADGSVVDVVWEVGIGNMGRVIFVFEVQSKGSIDSLLLNLLKSLNNPAVQGVVAVGNSTQLEKIRKNAAELEGLRNKLKYWDFEEVLVVHERFEVGYESITKLNLVPQGF